MNPKVDFYFRKAEKWQEELEKFRRILLDCQLSEELKSVNSMRKLLITKTIQSIP
jgi:uncharacterized protein YdeI (YjbR/CyaY-like superfamily)